MIQELTRYKLKKKSTLVEIIWKVTLNMKLDNLFMIFQEDLFQDVVHELAKRLGYRSRDAE